MSSSNATNPTTSTTPNEDVESNTEYVQQTDEQQAAVASTSFRKSHTCLKICDMRIATIFVNGLNIAMILVGVLVAAIRGPLFFKSIFIALGVGLPGLVLSGLGLYGAYQFELWAMYIATAGFLVAVILDIILFNWIGVVVTAIVLYPHAVLTYEIRSGIMTKDKYEKEEFLIPQGQEFVEKASEYMAPKDKQDKAETTTTTTE